MAGGDNIAPSTLPYIASDIFMKLGTDTFPYQMFKLKRFLRMSAFSLSRHQL